ncbi:MAG: hypothetical protein KGL39_20675 [Patescibacteria group bacterium]|nr:hypothetical protein [Patescibacteria group bacterium]
MTLKRSLYRNMLEAALHPHNVGSFAATPQELVAYYENVLGRHLTTDETNSLRYVWDAYGSYRRWDDLMSDPTITTMLSQRDASPNEPA